jgi:uncharacterized membrane protein
MNLRDYKIVIFAATAVVALIVASPAIQQLAVALPQGEAFTELWLLGPRHMAEGFPYNVAQGESYNIYLGVSNHLGHLAYYSVQVKFRNSTQIGPSSLNRTASSLPALCSIYAFVADNETWEVPVSFGFDYSYDSASSKVNFNNLLFNNAALPLSGYSSSWDSNKTVFFGDLIFELWLYNETVGGFQYNERYVDLKFNMTV